MHAKREAERIRNSIQRLAVFGGVSEPALRHIQNRAVSITVCRDDFFFREKGPVRSMYLLLDGQVTVVKSLDGCEYELCRLGPGECFGEWDLLDLRPRAVSVRALADCAALEISATVLREVCAIDETSFAIIHMNLGRDVRRRLRQLDDDLLKVRARGRETRRMDCNGKH